MKLAAKLDSEDIRIIIAKFFEIPVDDVMSNRYDFVIVANMSAEEIEKRINEH